MRRKSGMVVLLASIAIANVVFLEQWHFLFGLASPEVAYYVTSVSSSTYLAVLFDCALLGTLGWIVARWLLTTSHQSVRWFCGSLLLLFSLLAVNAIRREIVLSLAGLRVAHVPAIVAVSCVLVVLSAAYGLRGTPARALSFARAAGLVLTPFLLLTVFRVGAAIASGAPDRQFAAEPARATSSASEETARRVVVVIFDEADYRLMFEARPRDLHLPHFDELRRTSFFATSAIPPASETDLSIPALLTGQQADEAKPESSRELLLKLHQSNSWVRLTAQRTLFSAVASSGVPISVIGWNHPYCRLFGTYIEHCHARGLSSPPPGLWRAMAWFGSEALSVGPVPARAYGFGLPYHSLDYVDLMRHALHSLAADSSGLVFVHLPVPHLPRIYDRRARAFVGPQRYERGAYVDNLALADLALGEMRRAIDSNSLASVTTLIVTSDHPYRESRRYDGRDDPRVPFIVHLPGRGEGATYSKRVETIVMSNLVEEVLSGRLHANKDLEHLLDTAPDRLR